MWKIAIRRSVQGLALAIVLAGMAAPHQEAYYRLLSAGIVRQNAEGKVVFRCDLYRRYLTRLLAPT